MAGYPHVRRSSLDLRRLEPGRGPPPERRRRRRRGRVGRRPRARCRRSPPSSRVLLKAGPHARRCRSPGSRPATRTPSRWPATSASAPASARELGLVRDDHGGVLLHHGRIEAAGDGRRVAEPAAGAAGPPRRHQGRRRRDHPDRRPSRLAGRGHHRRDRDDCSRCARRGTPAAGPCRWPPTRRGSCATACPYPRAGHPLDLVRRPPGALAAPALTRARPRHRGTRQASSWTLEHPARRGGPAADVLRPDRAWLPPRRCR